MLVSSGCPEPTSSYGALSERAAVRVAGRMERSAAVFWGAGGDGRFFAEKCSVCSRVLSAVWSRPVRMRGQRFCVFDPTLTRRGGSNTGIRVFSFLKIYDKNSPISRFVPPMFALVTTTMTTQ